MALLKDPQGRTHLIDIVSGRLFCDRSPHGMVGVNGTEPTCNICAYEPEEAEHKGEVSEDRLTE